MISLERYGYEALGVVVLCSIFAGYWKLHNHDEQKLGAKDCRQETTETKTEVVTDNSDVEAAHAAQLSAVVKIYDAKVNALSAGNADLSERLSAALRQSAGPSPGSAAGPSATDRGLSEGESAAQLRLGRIRTDLKAVFDACDADHEKLIGAVFASDDWRQKMIELNAQR